MSVAALSLAAILAVPAHADVLEISADGEVRWISGGVPVADADVVAYAGPVGEVPTDVMSFLPDHAVADTRLHASGIPAAYAVTIHDLARRFDLSPALLEAVVWQESRWRADAVSPAGARGLAQLMPGTARDLGVDPDDPFANLEGGARYLREQLDRFDGDLERALAAYNAGPGRVIRSGGIPRIRETQMYVAAIMGRLSDHSRSPE
ncbi:transglycosylase [Aurantiacibacter marinus]|uniref:Transglycosylase n=2 Tax=Aurantiacibacter marinus TaxID=874156 RepID=A0A0H0XRV1_9SPHN|nr:transglycosylase [Aurantiacibacter marinus]